MNDMPRRKRWQVYSMTDAGNPLLVDSFDLRSDAQRLIDRMTKMYDQLPKEMLLRKPRFALVDGKEDTMEGMKWEANENGKKI